jgi:hypothetical protein
MPNGQGIPDLGICHSTFVIQAAFFSGLVGLWHNEASMFRGLLISLVLTSVGIRLPTRTG